MYFFRLLKRKMFKEELEPNWPGPDKVISVIVILLLDNKCYGLVLHIHVRTHEMC